MRGLQKLPRKWADVEVARVQQATQQLVAGQGAEDISDQPALEAVQVGACLAGWEQQLAGWPAGSSWTAGAAVWFCGRCWGWRWSWR
jgi:hypothetical protein